MLKPDDTLCTYCGMTCAQREYHPYGVCLMFKACRNSETVRANLAAMREHFQAEVRKDDESLIRQLWYLVQSQHDYIMALPADVVASLPAMPGFDGEWADGVKSAARARLEKAP